MSPWASIRLILAFYCVLGQIVRAKCQGVPLLIEVKVLWLP